MSDEAEAIKKELRAWDNRVERIVSGMENNSDLGRLTMEAGLTDADYENLIGELAWALDAAFEKHRGTIAARLKVADDGTASNPERSGT